MVQLVRQCLIHRSHQVHQYRYVASWVDLIPSCWILYEFPDYQVPHLVGVECGVLNREVLGEGNIFLTKSLLVVVVIVLVCHLNISL